ncbi:bacteriohemerythrin [Cupriavidus sp. IDO]|uniref:bacteriohemerythrin n=1 Tax=Cupriavidus sp. IDO TaxID=1539142 RepID=UPI00057992F5|nr:hemerythrin domain-containing protein [Cupriavidus sp. IDO]KWR87235.1 hemerythrin [Cupriavidus sp. IDO]
MTDVSEFAWHDEFALGHQSMDDMHHEFVACVHALLTASDGHLRHALDDFADHARRHFGEEDASMRETTYGSAGCHIDEHSAVLKSIDEVRERLDKGHTQVVRAFARALMDWFPEHVRVMDQGLARWLTQRRLGASPIVIQRRRHATAATL